MYWKVQFLLFKQARGFSSTQLPTYNLSNIAEQLNKKFKRVMVMVGAGLSTPSGIPDFRSPGTGLYSNLQKYNLTYPEQMFDLNFFQKHPEPFFDLAKELYPGKYQPNLCHYFILMLQEKGKLLRLYTQNIDGLERMAGIKEELLIEAHGTFATASCVICRAKHDPNKVREDVFKNIVSKCSMCEGIVKPDIVFFGEELPKRYHDYASIDPVHTDLLIVIGTSLEVFPFAWLGEIVPLDVPRLLINREAAGMLGTRKHDVIFLTDIIKGIEFLTKEIGWYEELKNFVTEKNCKQNEV